MSKKLIVQQNKLFRHLRSGIEIMIKKGRFGDWADTRTTATAIWAMSICSIQKKKPGYIQGTMQRLLQSTECERGENLINFNYEAWDTSLVLLALHESSMSIFNNTSKMIQTWLHNEFNLGNVRDEPWETLWVLLSLLSEEEEPRKHKEKYINAIDWLLKRRT